MWSTVDCKKDSVTHSPKTEESLSECKLIDFIDNSVMQTSNFIILLTELSYIIVNLSDI